MSDYELTYIWLALVLASWAIVGGIACMIETVWAGRRRYPREN